MVLKTEEEVTFQICERCYGRKKHETTRFLSKVDEDIDYCSFCHIFKTTAKAVTVTVEKRPRTEEDGINAKGSVFTDYINLGWRADTPKPPLPPEEERRFERCFRICRGCYERGEHTRARVASRLEEEKTEEWHCAFCLQPTRERLFVFLMSEEGKTDGHYRVYPKKEEKKYTAWPKKRGMNIPYTITEEKRPEPRACDECGIVCSCEIMLLEEDTENVCCLCGSPSEPCPNCWERHRNNQKNKKRDNIDLTLQELRKDAQQIKNDCMWTIDNRDDLYHYLIVEETEEHYDAIEKELLYRIIKYPLIVSLIESLKAVEKENIETFVENASFVSHLTYAMRQSGIVIKEETKELTVICDNSTDYAEEVEERTTTITVDKWTVKYLGTHATNNLACPGYCVIMNEYFPRKDWR